MASRVGIVSVAQTTYSAARYDAHQLELSWEVTQKVLNETGLKFADDGTGIDHQVIVCDDLWDGETLADVKYHDIVGGQMHDVTKVAQDGAQAIKYATAAIQSGHVEYVFILAICKESLIKSRNIIANYGFDPLFTRGLGFDNLAAAALQARAYMEKYGITREQCAQAVVKSRKNAKNNPFARNASELSIEEVLGAKLLASPIGAFDEYPVSDGACAMLLTNEKNAKKLTAKPVWINGVACNRDNFSLGMRDLQWCESLRLASDQAYKMAGISDPRKQIDLFEISEQYSYQELLWTEGLGLCGKGEGGKLIESGATQIGGSMPVNPSGGILAGVPTLVAGMSRAAEAVLQLRGEAGKNQIDNAKTAVAHGNFGPAGQLQTVIVMGTE